MDDNDFDSSLKSKFENYEFSGPVPNALDRFHSRLASYPSIPWHTLYRTEIFVAATFILFTLLNSLFYLNLDRKGNSSAELKSNKKEIIDSLLLVIDRLKVKQPASVFIIDPSAKTKKEMSRTPAVDQAVEMRNASALSTGSKFHLGSVSSLPKSIYDRLTEEGVLETEDGEAFLVITDRVKQIRHQAYSFEPISIIGTGEIDSASAPQGTNSIKLRKATIANNLSSKMVNKMEDHAYTAGMGIGLAPHVDLVAGVFSQGSGGLLPRAGLTAEWIVSPHWSLETSLDYINTKVTTDKNFQSFYLPHQKPELGGLENVQLNAHLLSMPINLKYRWWLTRKQLLVMKAGYSPYLVLRNQYIYTYPEQPPNSDLSISTVEQVDQLKFNGGTLNLAVGINRLTKKKNFFEVALFYEHSVGNFGDQKLAMQLFGVRTAYSIKLR